MCLKSTPNFLESVFPIKFRLNYFNETFAPASSRAFFKASASSFFMSFLKSIGFNFFIIICCLTISVHHLKRLSCLLVHNCLTEAFESLFKLFSTEITLTGLLEHLQVLENISGTPNRSMDLVSYFFRFLLILATSVLLISW